MNEEGRDIKIRMVGHRDSTHYAKAAEMVSIRWWHDRFIHHVDVRNHRTVFIVDSKVNHRHAIRG